MSERCLNPDGQSFAAHHWAIEPPDGPFSLGNCLKCGSEKEFANSLHDYDSWRGNSEMSDRRESVIDRYREMSREMNDSF